MRLRTTHNDPKAVRRRALKKRSETSLDAWAFKVPAREVNLYAHRGTIGGRFRARPSSKIRPRALERILGSKAIKGKKHRSLEILKDQDGVSALRKRGKVKTGQKGGNHSLRRRVLEMKYKSFNLKGKVSGSRGKENKREGNGMTYRACETMKGAFFETYQEPGGYAARIKAKAEALKRKVFLKCVRSQKRKSPNKKAAGYLRMFQPRRKRARVDVSKTSNRVEAKVHTRKKGIQMICSNQFTPLRKSRDPQTQPDAEMRIQKIKIRKNSFGKDPTMPNDLETGVQWDGSPSRIPSSEAFKKLFRSKSASQFEDSNKAQQTKIKAKRSIRLAWPNPTLRRRVVSHFDNRIGSRVKGESLRSWSKRLKQKSKDSQPGKQRVWKVGLKKRLLRQRVGGKKVGSLGKHSKRVEVSGSGRSINVMNNNVNNTTYLKCSINIFDHSRRFYKGGGKEQVSRKSSLKSKLLKSPHKANIRMAKNKQKIKSNVNNIAKTSQQRIFNPVKVTKKIKSEPQILSEETTSNSRKWIIPRPPCAEKWLLAVEDLISELSPERESSSRGDIGTVLKTSKESPVPGGSAYPVQEKQLWTERTSKKDNNQRRVSGVQAETTKTATTSSAKSLTRGQQALQIRVPAGVSGKEPQVEISLPESPNIKIMLPKGLTRELLESLRISCTTPKDACPSFEKYLNSISKCIKEMNFITKVENLESEGKEIEGPNTPRKKRVANESGISCRVPRRSFKKKPRARGRIKAKNHHVLGPDSDIKQSDLGQFIELMGKPGGEMGGQYGAGLKSTAEKIKTKILNGESTQKKKSHESPVSDATPSTNSVKLDFLRIEGENLASLGGSSGGSYPHTSGQCSKSKRYSNYKMSPWKDSRSRESPQGMTLPTHLLSHSKKSSNWKGFKSVEGSKPSSAWTDSKKSSNWKDSESSLYQFKSLNHRTITEGSGLNTPATTTQISSKNSNKRSRFVNKASGFKDLGKRHSGFKDLVVGEREEGIGEIEGVKGVEIGGMDGFEEVDQFADIYLDKKAILSNNDTTGTNQMMTESGKGESEEGKEGEQIRHEEGQQINIGSERESPNEKQKTPSSQNLRLADERRPNTENLRYSKSNPEIIDQEKASHYEDKIPGMSDEKERSQNSFSDIYVGVSQAFESAQNFELEEALLSEQKAELHEKHSFSVSDLKIIRSRQIFGNRAQSPNIDSKTSRPNSEQFRKSSKSKIGLGSDFEFEDIASTELNRILISSFKTKGETRPEDGVNLNIEGLLKGIQGMSDDLLDPLECQEMLKKSEAKTGVGEEKNQEIAEQTTQISNLQTGTFRNRKINPFLKPKISESEEENVFYEEVQDHLEKIEIMDICDPDSPRTLNLKKKNRKTGNRRSKNGRHHFSETNNSLPQNSMRSPKKGINVLAHLRRIKDSFLTSGSVRFSAKSKTKANIKPEPESQPEISIYDRLRLQNVGSHRMVKVPSQHRKTGSKTRLRIKPRESLVNKELNRLTKNNNGKPKPNKKPSSKKLDFKRHFKRSSGRELRNGIKPRFSRHQYSLSNNFVPNGQNPKLKAISKRKRSRQLPGTPGLAVFPRPKRSQPNLNKHHISSALMAFPKTNNLTFCENEYLYSPEMSFGPKVAVNNPDSLYLHIPSPRHLEIQSQYNIPGTGAKSGQVKGSKYGSFGDFGNRVQGRQRGKVKNMFSKKFSVRHVRSPHMLKKPY